jgi:hypothetical protein
MQRVPAANRMTLAADRIRRVAAWLGFTFYDFEQFADLKI